MPYDSTCGSVRRFKPEENQNDLRADHNDPDQFHLHRCTFVEYVPHLVVHLLRQVIVPIRHRDVSVAQDLCQFLHLHTSVGHASCKRVPQVMKAHCRIPASLRTASHTLRRFTLALANTGSSGSSVFLWSFSLSSSAFNRMLIEISHCFMFLSL